MAETHAALIARLQHVRREHLYPYGDNVDALLAQALDDAILALHAAGERETPADYEWAVERVRKMHDSASTNAALYGTKLLKGHGYPDEVMGDAQDALALGIVLTTLGAPPVPEQE